MLELKNISFSVNTPQGIKHILKEISFCIPSSCFFVITGPNGSGKSTLAKIIAGIEQPTSGEIWLNGQDITNWSVPQRAQSGLGFAFQQPVRFKGLTVQDLLSLAAKKTLSLEQACAYLSEVGLCAEEYVRREVNASLSGGELKRIEIATVLATNSTVAVFDEPEAGIDLWSFQHLIEVFHHLREEKQSASIIISHQERILEIADTIAVLSQGRIESIGSRQEIYPNLLTTMKDCPLIEGDR